MLYISDDKGNVIAEWHVGEPMPALYDRVLYFQADGDELDLLLAIMRKSNDSRVQ